MLPTSVCIGVSCIYKGLVILISSINSDDDDDDEDDGKLLPASRQTVTHNPLFFFEKRRDNYHVSVINFQQPNQIKDLDKVFELACYFVYSLFGKDCIV